MSKRPPLFTGKLEATQIAQPPRDRVDGGKKRKRNFSRTAIILGCPRFHDEYVAVRVTTCAAAVSAALCFPSFEKILAAMSKTVAFRCWFGIVCTDSRATSLGVQNAPSMLREYHVQKSRVEKRKREETEYPSEYNRDNHCKSASMRSNRASRHQCPPARSAAGRASYFHSPPYHS